MGEPTKLAAAFLRYGKVFLHPYSRTTGSLWIFSVPVVVVGSDDAGIGRQVLSVLSESRQEVPHPTSWKALTAPLLEVAGVRSFNAFAKSARCVEISLDDGVVTVTPTKNGGPKDGFLHLGDRAVRCEPSEEEVAAALHAVFGVCE